MIGLLCPGQGSQHVGMGRDLAEVFSIAHDTFMEADEALGVSISRLCWEGPEADLTLTVNAQPAILVHSIAVWRVLTAELDFPVGIAAGHSLGEFSAHVAAGTFSFADAVRVVRRRGELMYKAGLIRPGTMTAILGLDDAVAEQICERAAKETGEVVVAANYNSPGQLVLSGDAGAVRRAGDLAADQGAKRVVPLNVSGAFHSPLMEPAAVGLGETLDAIKLSDPVFPVVSNVTGAAVDLGADARSLLLRQLTSPVRWAQCVHTMIAHGVTEFVEVGPGNVLTGLLRRLDRSASGRALGTAEQVGDYLRQES